MSPRELSPEVRTRIAELKKVVDANPGSPLFMELAELLRREGRLAEAYEVARQGVVYNRENGWAHFVFGRICLEMGKLMEAEKELTEASSALSREPAPYLLLGQTLIRKRDYNGARIVLTNLEERFPTNSDVARFRRYLEQKLIPPLDFGVPDTEQLVEKFKGAAPPPPPVKTSVQPVEVIVSRPEEISLDERAKSLVTSIARFTGIQDVIFITRESKIYRTSTTTMDKIRAYNSLFSTIYATVKKYNDKTQLGLLKNIVIETEQSRFLIVVLRDGWIGVILDIEVELGSFRIQLARLLRRFDFTTI